MNPLNWTAEPFLTLYLQVATLALALVVVLRWWIGRGKTGDAAGLDAVQIAYLAGGPKRAADTALVGLLEYGAVVLTRKGLSAARSLPVLPAAFRPYAALGHGTFNRTRFVSRASEVGERLGDGLARRGLAPTGQSRRRYHTAAAALLALPLLLGTAKAVVGMSRGHPVGILILFLGVTGLLGFVLARMPYSTEAGNTALQDIRQEHARAARAPLRHELPLAFALTGAAVLAGRGYQAMFVNTAGGSGGSGGDSGGSGGDGGCGGGCGGCS